MEWKYYTSLLASFKNDIWHKSNGSSFFHVNVFLFEVTWLFTWASVIIENISDFEIVYFAYLITFLAKFL